MEEVLKIKTKTSCSLRTISMRTFSQHPMLPFSIIQTKQKIVQVIPSNENLGDDHFRSNWCMKSIKNGWLIPFVVESHNQKTPATVWAAYLAYYL